MSLAPARTTGGRLASLALESMAQQFETYSGEWKSEGKSFAPAPPAASAMRRRLHRSAPGPNKRVWRAQRLVACPDVGAKPSFACSARDLVLVLPVASAWTGCSNASIAVR